MQVSRFAPVVLLAACFSGATTHAREGAGRVLFQDDFETGLSKWIIEGRDAVSIHRTPTDHAAVLRLKPNGGVHALIRGSEKWGNVRAWVRESCGPETASQPSFIWGLPPETDASL